MSQELPSAEQYAAERAGFPARAVVDLQALQRSVHERYRNQVVVDVNDACLRMSVFEGELHIEFADRPEAVLDAWQCLVVPAGTVHRTRAVGRTVNVTFERQGAQTRFVDPPGGVQ